MVPSALRLVRSGIGEQFAHQLTARRVILVLVRNVNLNWPQRDGSNWPHFAVPLGRWVRWTFWWPSPERREFGAGLFVEPVWLAGRAGLAGVRESVGGAAGFDDLPGER